MTLTTTIVIIITINYNIVLLKVDATNSSRLIIANHAET